MDIQVDYNFNGRFLDLQGVTFLPVRSQKGFYADYKP